MTSKVSSQSTPCQTSLEAARMDRVHDRRLHFWDHQWKHLVDLKRAIKRVVLQHARVEPGQTVVDIGCGTRPYQSLFRQLGLEYIACDLDGDCDIVIEPQYPIPLEDACADIIVSFQVLEHVWDLDWYLGECLRLLKPEGRLILSTHGTWLYHPHPTDYRRWTRDGLIAELQSRGFAVEHTAAVMGPLAWTTQFRLLGIRHVLQKIPVIGRILEVPVTCMLNLRMVIEDAITPASIRDVNASAYVTCSRKSSSDV